MDADASTSSTTTFTSNTAMPYRKTSQVASDYSVNNNNPTINTADTRSRHHRRIHIIFIFCTSPP